MTADASTRPTDDQIAAALRQARGNITDAADALGITRQTVYTRVQTSQALRTALWDARAGLTGDPADIVISTRVTPDVARAIDQRRGSMTRSEYLRHMLQQIAAQPSAR